MTATPPLPIAAEADHPVQTVSLVSLGCPKNLVDSEKMMGLLAEAGLTPVPPDQPCDAVVINTCGFLEASKEESLGEIRTAVDRKQAGEVQRVVVAGCLVQRHRAKLLDWAPGVDALIGVYDRDRVLAAVRGPAAGEAAATAGQEARIELPVYSSIAGSATLARQARHLDADQAPGYFESDEARLRLTPRHYAYLRMSEGCNQNCSFCTIPSIRGKMRSKPVEAIRREMTELLQDGAFELNLIGQDTTSYGQDIGYEPGLVGLLEAMDAEAARHGGAWLRLMYAYPSCFTDAMIDAIARLPNVLKYIDMPLQHINDMVLDRMRRRTSRNLIEQLLAKLRDRVPGITIRTTMISGFPGETEDQHRELVSFIQGFGFDALGVFGYSPEPGTPSARMHANGDAVPQDVIQRRVEELMLAQQEVAFARNEALVEQGWRSDVLIDTEEDAAAEVGDEAEEDPAAQGEPLRVYRGRGPHQAPDIDGVTYVLSRQHRSPGELLNCRVVDYEGYDLLARPVEELQPSRRLPVLG